MRYSDPFEPEVNRCYDPSAGISDKAAIDVRVCLQTESCRNAKERWLCAPNHGTTAASGPVEAEWRKQCIDRYTEYILANSRPTLSEELHPVTLKSLVKSHVHAIFDVVRRRSESKCPSAEQFKTHDQFLQHLVEENLDLQEAWDIGWGKPHTYKIGYDSYDNEHCVSVEFEIPTRPVAESVVSGTQGFEGQTGQTPNEDARTAASQGVGAAFSNSELNTNPPGLSKELENSMESNRWLLGNSAASASTSAADASVMSKCRDDSEGSVTVGGTIGLGNGAAPSTNSKSQRELPHFVDDPDRSAIESNPDVESNSM
ncbi:hypothetical protein I302_104592 [Kwoniella bestiolae CBS 10118]|uniref:Uncharacterized protein n=1 Tax=Kwoniella bestiolae CBS 10118 TaxID=1296100 RepID=A0A1B9GBP7_9TREE|nr:hypothetical protein I302_03298 [Kwoniella bestiolae CBS 10118]OCF28439.1 hypothetical protein I302_03298 [Kwoniella bestiolae CBS 10118]